MGMAEGALGGGRRIVAIATIVLVAVAALLATRAAKAESKASGKVSKVVVSNINGGAAEQIAGIRNLISAGANAIIINPSDRNALNGVINEASARGIVVV